MSYLVGRKEVAEVVGYELATLIGSDNMWDEFMGEAKEKAEVGEEEFKAALSSFFRGGMAREKAHEAGAGINGAAVASVVMREAGGEGSFEV